MATGLEAVAVVFLVNPAIKAIIFASTELVNRDKSLEALCRSIEWAYKHCLDAEALLAESRAVFRIHRHILHLRRSLQKAHQHVWGRLGQAIMKLDPKALSALLSSEEISIEKIHWLIKKSKIKGMSASIHQAQVELGAALANLSNNPDVSRHLQKRDPSTAATPPPSSEGTSRDPPRFAEPAPAPFSHFEPASAPPQPSISIVVSRPSQAHKQPQSVTSSHLAPTATSETGGMRKGAQPPPAPSTRPERPEARPEQSSNLPKQSDGSRGRPEGSKAPKKRYGRSRKRAEPSSTPERSGQSRDRTEPSPTPPGRSGPKTKPPRPTPGTGAQPDPTRGRTKSAAASRADGSVRRAQPPAAASAASPNRRQNARDKSAAPRGRRGGMRGGMRGGAQFQPTPALSMAFQTGLSSTRDYNINTAGDDSKDGDDNTADDGNNNGADATGGPQDYDDPEDYQPQDCEAEDYEYEPQEWGWEGGEDVEFDGDEVGEAVGNLLECFADVADCTFGDTLSAGF